MLHPFAWQSSRAALIIAHPGHELRLHGWMKTAKPLTFVLTDGSGGAGHARLASTTTVLNRVGAIPGAIYGRFADKQVYQRVMEHRHDVFCALVDEVAAALVAARIDYVAGDAAEGYNSSHDLCRMLIGAALTKLKRTTGRELPNYDFPLMGRPDAIYPGMADQVIHLRLDDAALQRKHVAADAYPELAEEIARATAAGGFEVFRQEVLRPCDLDFGYAARTEKPYYETYGEKMVAAGRYASVLTWADHMQPLAQALWKHVNS